MQSDPGVAPVLVREAHVAMTLSSDKLKTELRKFQDLKFAQFGAFPQSASDAASLEAETKADDLATAFYKATVNAVQTKCTTQSPSGVATAGQPFAYG